MMMCTVPLFLTTAQTSVEPRTPAKSLFGWACRKQWPGAVRVQPQTWRGSICRTGSFSQYSTVYEVWTSPGCGRTTLVAGARSIYGGSLPITRPGRQDADRFTPPAACPEQVGALGGRTQGGPHGALLVCCVSRPLAPAIARLRTTRSSWVLLLLPWAAPTPTRHLGSLP